MLCYCESKEEVDKVCMSKRPERTVRQTRNSSAFWIISHEPEVADGVWIFGELADCPDPTRLEGRKLEKAEQLGGTGTPPEFRFETW